MKRSNTCFFTGHRYIANERIDSIITCLRNNIINLIEYGVTDFICGGALGFDTLCEELLLKLRDEEGYDIKIHIYLPCLDNDVKWTKKQKDVFKQILIKVNDYKYISDTKYFDGCMKLRNKAMANDSSFCIAFMLNSITGTGSAVRYANEIGIKIINLADEIYGE